MDPGSPGDGLLATGCAVKPYVPDLANHEALGLDAGLGASRLSVEQRLPGYILGSRALTNAG